MFQKKEATKQKKLYPWADEPQGETTTALCTVPVTSNGMSFPYHGHTIIQHFHAAVFTPPGENCLTCRKRLISRIAAIILEFLQLSPLEQDKVIKMVKDSSITAPVTTGPGTETVKIVEVILVVLDLAPGQWEAILETAKNTSTPAPAVE